MLSVDMYTVFVWIEDRASISFQRFLTQPLFKPGFYSSPPSLKITWSFVWYLAVLQYKMCIIVEATRPPVMVCARLVLSRKRAFCARLSRSTQEMMERSYVSNPASIRTQPLFEPQPLLKNSCANPRLYSSSSLYLSQASIRTNTVNCILQYLENLLGSAPFPSTFKNSTFGVGNKSCQTATPPI